MWFKALSFLKSDSPARSNSANQSKSVRPTLEHLETREVPAGNILDGLLGGVGQGLVPISFNSVLNQGNQLTALGQVGANPVAVPLAVTGSGTPNAPVLNLHLGPINLDLLGLNVQTSEICLNITAQQGSGNLLGNLVYDLAHALDSNGNNLGGAISGLNPIDQVLLPFELATLLNGGLNSATSPSALGNTSPTHVPSNATDIAFLSVGPLNLNLLGLNVALNNCANPGGPVTVDVYTTPTGLLGNLLGGVANALNPTGTGTDQALAGLVGDVLNVI